MTAPKPFGLAHVEVANWPMACSLSRWYMRVMVYIILEDGVARKGFSLRGIGQALIEVKRVPVLLHRHMLMHALGAALDLVVVVPLGTGLNAEDS